MNKLSVNPAKTNTVIIPLKRTKAPISHLSLTSNETSVNIVSCAKYPEVIIDFEPNKVIEGKSARLVGIQN